MKFEPIDWSKYNRPPYLPQWLSCGETQKFTSFDDKQLVELEGQSSNMSEQYDIENVKAILLDRIGKILSEPRMGNDDELYRLLLKLRQLLNTTDGSVNDIIKVIRFLYSSEEVHIIPNYPAAISILHDGESPSVDFNSIIAQVIGAGIAYDTTELFDFTDDLHLLDKAVKTVRRNTIDLASHGVLRDGRVLRDGKTIRHFGPQDTFTMGIIDGNYIDEHKSRVLRNGAFIRNGLLKRTGFAPYSANDSIQIDTLKLSFVDNVTVSEEIATKVIETADNTIGRDYTRNGAHFRNGTLFRSSNGIVDPFASIPMQALEPETDSININDSIITGMRFHYFRDGTRVRNGTIKRKGMIFIPLE